MNLYQVGYYRIDAGNVVTFIDSIIVKEEKNHYYEITTDYLVPALKQITPGMKLVKEGMKFIFQADISPQHLVSEQQAIAYLEGNKKAIQNLRQQIQEERGELHGFDKIKARARQLFK